MDRRQQKETHAYVCCKSSGCDSTFVALVKKCHESNVAESPPGRLSDRLSGLHGSKGDFWGDWSGRYAEKAKKKKKQKKRKLSNKNDLKSDSKSDSQIESESIKAKLFMAQSSTD